MRRHASDILDHVFSEIGTSPWSAVSELAYHCHRKVNSICYAPEMLEIRDLNKSFQGRLVVKHISLDIPRGQRVAILGRSGAGKSTLVRMINRLETPSSGSIRHKTASGSQEIVSLKGKALRRWRSRCAMIFQQFNLVGRLDVQTNVLFGRLHRRSPFLTQFGWFPLDDRLDAFAALDRLGLADHALKRTDQLSGGQQQRVAIARAMLQEPDLILADEPTSSLDPGNAETVLRALRDMADMSGATIICNLHMPELALKHFDRIIGMAAGEVILDRPAKDLSLDEVAMLYEPSGRAGSASSGAALIDPMASKARTEMAGPHTA